MGRPSHIIVATDSYQKLSLELEHYLRTLGYHPRSCRSHYLRIREFFYWLEQQGIESIEQVNTSHIEQYQSYLGQRPSRKDRAPLSGQSIYGHLRGVAHLFDMLQGRGLTTVHPMGTFTIPYPLEDSIRSILTKEEITELYNHCESYLERTILSLAYGCGLRAGEVERCNVEDLQLHEGIIIVPQGKGNKRRVVPTSKAVIRDLSGYFNLERQEPTDPTESNKPTPKQALLLHSRGGRMREYTCNKVLRRITGRTVNTALQSKAISLHTLRHTIATHLLENGVTVEQVRQFLGHSHIETTQTYTHISQQQLNLMTE